MLEDVAAVGVCGFQPVSQRSCSVIGSMPSPSPAIPHMFNSCTNRLRGGGGGSSDTSAAGRAGAADARSGSMLSRLFLQPDALKDDQRGLIKQFEPQGGRLYVAGRVHAMNTQWLQDRGILAGRALRCLRVLPHDAYPEMLALEFPVDDVLNEPILGYHTDRPGNLRGVAAARREQARAALRFIHEGIQRGEAVLVHCRMGINRSAAVAAAYLVVYAGMPAREALGLLESRGTTPRVVRQPGFTEQLLLLQQEVALQRSIVRTPPPQKNLNIGVLKN